MRRKNGYNRKQAVKKERAIMLVSSAFVLTALTLTGIYVKQNNKEDQYDGYTVDFSSLENNANDKFDEISQNADNASDLLSGLKSVDSGDIQIPGLTDGTNIVANEPQTSLDEIEAPYELIDDLDLAEATDLTIDEPIDMPPVEDAPVIETHPALQYEENKGLAWPVSGDILIDYSMEKTTYFPTLDQYKCSNAVVISAEEGTPVTAAASGQVIYVLYDSEIGNAVAVDLGNGYVLTYGQLENVTVSAGSYLNAGDSFATVAKPTKYFSVEGSNLYFKMTKDGAPMNPLNLMTDY